MSIHCTILKPFPYSQDGQTVRDLKPDTVEAIHPHLVDGLEKAGYVRRTVSASSLGDIDAMSRAQMEAAISDFMRAKLVSATDEELRDGLKSMASQAKEQANEDADRSARAPKAKAAKPTAGPGAEPGLAEPEPAATPVAGEAEPVAEPAPAAEASEPAPKAAPAKPKAKAGAKKPTTGAKA
jgi:hypothetical protein